MFPYTAEEAEWLSAHADRHYWLLGQGDLELATAANDDAPPHDHGSQDEGLSRCHEDFPSS